MVPLASIFDFNAEKILKVLAALKQCRCFFLRHYSWGTMRTRDSAECRNGETPCLTFDAFDHSFFGWGTTGTMAHLWTKWHLVGLLATNPKFASRCSSCGRASVDVLCPVLNVFFILIAIHIIHALVKQNFGQSPWLCWRCLRSWVSRCSRNS